VGHFFRLTGMHWTARKKKQEMIFSIAIGWYRITKKVRACPGFEEHEIYLTNLNRRSGGATKIVEAFFDIKKKGFNFANISTSSPTIVTAKKLGPEFISAIEALLGLEVFLPGNRPSEKNHNVSKVKINTAIKDDVMARLVKEDRDDLLPMVDWLFSQEGDVDFYFKKAGEIGARETSVWPIRAIELWPGWLRRELFGVTIDLENAFCQFLVTQLEKKHKSNSKLLHLQYPDIMMAVYNKTEFRYNICANLMKLPFVDENIKIVKGLVMAISNGSNVSGKMLMNSVGHSMAVDIIVKHCEHLTTLELFELGEKLGSIARQFRAAKKEVYLYSYNINPTRARTKKIPAMYMQWERKSRHQMWELVGKTGIMMHDGLDGVWVPPGLSHSDLVQLIYDKTHLLVSVE